MARRDSYQQLIQKLDSFIRKYYFNLILKGSLLWFGLAVLMFLTFALLESQFWFSTSVRQLLFYSFIGIAGVTAWIWVIIPLSKYFQLGNVISHEQAAQIIGTHFPNVQDKLLNILQLQSQLNDQKDNSLLLAGIDQKAAEVRPVPFLSVIDLKKNRRYLKYAMPPLLLVLLLLWINPVLLTDSSKRILQNQMEFQKPAPFQFELENENLEVIQYEDFTVRVRTSGELRPEEARIELGEYTYNMKKVEPGLFEYKMSQVKEPLSFRFQSGRVQSGTHELKVIEKPQLSGFSMRIQPPAYTGLPARKLENRGDATVPEGSKIEWAFDAEGVELIELLFEDQAEGADTADRRSESLFDYSKRLYQDRRYRLYISSSRLPRADSSSYQVLTRKDRYPSIRVRPFTDSTDQGRIFFAGEVADDYGISQLHFVQEIRGSSGDVKVDKEKLDPRGNPYAFEHLLEIDSLQLEPGDRLTYYFEVYDNDRINGPKVSRSQVMDFSKPTLEEYEDMAKTAQNEVERKLEENVRERKQLKEEIKSLRNQLLNKKQLDWRDKQNLEKLLKQQEQLQKQLEEAKEKFDQKKATEEEFQEMSEEEQKKQEELEKMFEELTKDDEMEELMEKIRELMQEMKKDDALDMLEEMEESESKMEMTTERLEKMFRQLEFERDLQRELDKVSDLAQKQEELENKTRSEEEEQNTDSLANQQDQLNKEFEDIQKEVNELRKKSKDLPSPRPMDGVRDQMREIEKEMDRAKQQLDAGDKEKGAQHQKKAKEKMQEMQESTQSNMASSSMEQMQEDLELLRQILENLITVSHDQEDVISKIERVSPLTPLFTSLTQDQFGLEGKFQIVEDSLIALSQRNMQIETFVLDKISEVNSNFKDALDYLKEREKEKAGRHQQLAMKNLNDLALMMSEAMQQMQEQMSSMMPGSQMCQKPKPSMNPQKGKGKMPLDKITEGQKKLNEEMKEKAKENRKKGGKDGKSAEEFAKMAREQAKLRKLLREIQKQKQEQGQGDPQLQELLDQMNQMETDLVNKRLTNEMLKRQQEIVTRLLESERAERRQQQKEERKAEQAKEFARDQRPPELEEYLRERKAAVEQLRKVAPSLKPYYKEMVEGYYEELGNGK